MEKILVAVDGSEPSLGALRSALHLAKRLDDPVVVTVVQVIEPFGPLPGHFEAPPPGEDRVEWLSTRRFEGARAELERSGVTWDRIVVEGNPPDCICRVAQEGEFDLVVVGDRGHSAIARFLTGSVADRVVHHAPCSVLVVR